MKTEPTDTDREAARLFTPAPGMRACSPYTHGRVAGVGIAPDGVTHAALTGEGGFEALAEVVAFDTDDPATVGAMLAQLRAAAPGLGTGVLHTRPMPTTEDPGRWAVVSCGLPMAWGLTEGAAVVAAMKEVHPVIAEGAWPTRGI